MKRKILDYVLAGVWATAGATLAALYLTGCHFADFVKDQGTGAPGDLIQVLPQLPGAAAGSPAAWIAIAGTLAAAAGTAIFGHKQEWWTIPGPWNKVVEAAVKSGENK